MEHRPAYRQALLRAARQLGGEPACELGEADEVQNLGHAPAIDTVESAEEGQVLGGRQRRVETGSVSDVANSRS